MYIFLLACNGNSEIVRQEILANFPQLQGHIFRLKKAANSGPNTRLDPLDDNDDQSIPSVPIFKSMGYGLIYIVPDNPILPDNFEAKNIK
jgi:hypothetical protein